MKFSQIFVPLFIVLSVLIILAIQNTVLAANVHFHKLPTFIKTHPHHIHQSQNHINQNQHHIIHQNQHHIHFHLVWLLVMPRSSAYGAFGAAGDGVTDDTQAFSKGWDAAWQAERSSVVFLVPDKYSFLAQSILFKGPCKSYLLFQVIM